MNDANLFKSKYNFWPVYIIESKNKGMNLNINSSSSLIVYDAFKNNQQGFILDMSDWPPHLVTESKLTIKYF